MALVIIRNDEKTPIWMAAFQEFDSSLKVYDYRKPHPEEEIRMAAVWKHPHHSLYTYKNLSGVHSMGAGVDFILNDPNLNRNWPILRVKNEHLASDMAEYILTHILSVLKDLSYYHSNKFQKHWHPLAYKRMSEVTVGIMGLGTLGQAASELLTKCGIPCLGWTRETQPKVPFPVYSGWDSLSLFLSKSQILICLLPLTPETQNILNNETLAHLPKGAHLINVARGPLLVESDLITALDNGQLSGATLDVFVKEPLGTDHPFWKHPKIFITPHMASVSDPKSVVPQIVQNYYTLLEGGSLQNRVNLNRGY
ncbi:MAG: hypothetical protein RLZZ241_640 [Bacteroidota bacterium]|jgi:glyoxylate/hydroxypyruvate reductase A